MLTLRAIDALDTGSATTAVTGDRLQINVSHGEFVANEPVDTHSGPYWVPGTDASVAMTGNLMTVRQNGYVLTCHRDGKVNFPNPKPT